MKKKVKHISVELDIVLFKKFSIKCTQNEITKSKALIQLIKKYSK